MHKIFALPGSLRSNSSSNLILKTIVSLAPADIQIEVFIGLGDLPHFNHPGDDPSVVADFKAKLRHADAVLICTPEYAFGIPGSLKNALDWTVGSGEFVDKPVGLITASSQGEKGHAALLLVLSAISAKVIDESTMLISFVRAKLNADGNVKDNELLIKLKQVVPALVLGLTKKMNIL